MPQFDFVHRIDHLHHLPDRVDRLFPHGDVFRVPQDVDRHPDDSGVDSHDGLRPEGLGNNGHVRRHPAFESVYRPHPSLQLSHHARHDYISLKLHPRLPDGLRRRYHRSYPTLHVERPASVQPVPFPAGRPRVPFPAHGQRVYVDVPVQHQALAPTDPLSVAIV